MSEKHPVQVYVAAPADENRPGEASRWQRFVAYFLPKLFDASVLAERGARARIEQMEAEASKARFEAMKVAAEAEKIAAEAEVQRQVAYKTAAASIDEHLAGLSPSAAEDAKWAKFLEMNPHVAEQIERVRKLESEYGIRAALQDGSPPKVEKLPPPIGPQPPDRAA